MFAFFITAPCTLVVAKTSGASKHETLQWVQTMVETFDDNGSRKSEFYFRHLGVTLSQMKETNASIMSHFLLLNRRYRPNHSLHIHVFLSIYLKFPSTPPTHTEICMFCHHALLRMVCAYHPRRVAHEITKQNIICEFSLFLF